MILFEAQSCDVFNVDENHYSKGSVQEEKKQSLMETIYVCHRPTVRDVASSASGEQLHCKALTRFELKQLMVVTTKIMLCCHGFRYDITSWGVFFLLCVP